MDTRRQIEVGPLAGKGFKPPPRDMYLRYVSHPEPAACPGHEPEVHVPFPGESTDAPIPSFVTPPVRHPGTAFPPHSVGRGTGRSPQGEGGWRGRGRQAAECPRHAQRRNAACGGAPSTRRFAPAHFPNLRWGRKVVAAALSTPSRRKSGHRLSAPAKRGKGFCPWAKPKGASRLSPALRTPAAGLRPGPPPLAGAEIILAYPPPSGFGLFSLCLITARGPVWSAGGGGGVERVLRAG